MDNLWNRRTNSGKLSLSTPGTGSAAPTDPTNTRNASFSKRFGGDSSSHGKSNNNPFSAAATTTPGGLASPGASSAFGLGSGAFASFGSGKTPKSPGNPFDFAMKSAPGAGGGSNTAAADRGPVGSMGGGHSAAATKSISGAKGTSAAAAAAAAGAVGGAAGSALTRHPLRHEWVFWFRPPISKANGYIEYEKTLHAMCHMGSAEEFFSVYAHLKRPSDLPLVSDYHLFKKGIRPIWEDDENKKGGKWIVRLKKGVADRYWEDLLLAIIGDQFVEASDEVCGAVLSVRNGEDILSIWTRNNGGRVLKIREIMRRVLNFPAETKVEWKSHDSSITAVEESRREKANRNSKPSGSSHPPAPIAEDQKNPGAS